MDRDDQVQRIFILSDGTEKTGKRLLEAALLQVDEAAMLIRLPHIRTVDEVKEVVTEATQRGGMIVRQTHLKELRLGQDSASLDQRLIRQELRHGLALCHTHRWPVVEVTGNAMREIANEVVHLIASRPATVEAKL